MPDVLVLVSEAVDSSSVYREVRQTTSSSDSDSVSVSLSESLESSKLEPESMVEGKVVEFSEKSETGESLSYL